MKIKNVQSTVTETIDKETGELLDVSVKKLSILVDDERFMLVYVSFWDVITQSNLSKSDLELFAHLVSQYAKGTLFTITSDIKKIVADKSNKSLTSYNNSTRKLLEANFILKEGKQSYIINPVYAYEGSSKNRKRLVLDLIVQGKIDL